MLIKSATRRAPNQTPALLDHIYSNICHSQLDAGTISYDISDHLPTFLLVNDIGSVNKKCQILRRNYQNFQGDEFVDELEEKLRLLFNAIPSIKQTNKLIFFLTLL